jgi:sulfite reductase (NADPH) flavoprotein alpha-component
VVDELLELRGGPAWRQAHMGDAKRMAGDVDLALQQIAVTQGGMDAASAKRYFADLARDGRYLRDVY